MVSGSSVVGYLDGQKPSGLRDDVAISVSAQISSSFDSVHIGSVCPQLDEYNSEFIKQQ